MHFPVSSLRWLPLFLILLAGNLVAQDRTFERSTAVYFATASAELDATARSVLEGLITEQTGLVASALVVEAHTDERGTEAYNEALAQRRARSVADYLDERGLPARSVRVLSFGESQARFREGGTDHERRLDRRVDIRVVQTGWNDLEAVTTELRKGRSQRFRFSADAPQLLEGERGGRFLIDAGSFADTEGKVYTGPVVAELTECYTMDEMLLAQLSTTAQGKLLETGGMLQLTARTPAGEPLSLAKGRRVYASIPARDFDPDMRIFYGREHGADEAPADWEASTGRVQAGFEAFLPGVPPRAAVNIDRLVGKRMNRWLKENPRPKAPDYDKQRREVDPGPAPERQDFHYRPQGIFNRLFLSERKRVATEEWMFENAVRRHEKDTDRYAKAVTHNAALAERNARKRAEHTAAVAAWTQLRDAQHERTVADLRTAYAEQFRQDSINYAQWREQRLIQMEAAFAENGVTDQRFADRYFFEISELGWVNCDVFWNTSGEKADLLVRSGEATTPPKVLLVLREPRSLLPLRFDGRGNYRASDLPVGQATDLIAYKVEDGRLYLAEDSFVISADLEVELSYRPIAVTELRKVLARYESS